jgi:hypothetical protein
MAENLGAADRKFKAQKGARFQRDRDHSKDVPLRKTQTDAFMAF